MRILFLHGWQSKPKGVKPTFLAQNGHTVLNPKLPDEDFAAALAIAQAEFDKHQPDVIVGSSRGGALAMNLQAGETPLVLLCPAWKKYGTVKTIRANCTILHSRADDVIPFADSEELSANSGATLIEVGNDHRLADPEPLAAMLKACEEVANETGVATDEADSQMALVFSFYEGVERKGPGSEESTLNALNLLDGLPTNPRIVEFGCGAGVATIALARIIPCHITAVDIHQPFLDELDRCAVRAGLSDRITTLKSDMGNPPFPDESLDVVWSEGAIYNIGFEQGLKRWRRLLQTGGYIAVSEAVWLSENPPQGAKGFWEAEYPAMTSVEKNLSRFSATGFEPVGHFILPPTDWENYYMPLQSHLAEYRKCHTENSDADSLMKSVQREIDIWREFGTTFGYAFFVGRAV